MTSKRKHRDRQEKADEHDNGWEGDLGQGRHQRGQQERDRGEVD